MSSVKRLLCLANSRKLSGRCVAGKVIVQKGGGEWIRPVSDRPSQEVSESERQYRDGSDPRVLDIIEIPLLAHQPKSYQDENWLLDPKSYWVLVGRSNWSELQAFSDDPPALWLNNSSTYSGSNDRVSLADSAALDCSLYLLHLDRLALRVFAPGVDFGNPKLRVQAVFSHRGTKYSLWVTDPVIERTYLLKREGDYDIGECFVTVSLGEAHEGFCYKLVATIITPETE
jgi:hypothetical protein